jgi:hypothetical protein
LPPRPKSSVSKGEHVEEVSMHDSWKESSKFTHSSREHHREDHDDEDEEMGQERVECNTH